MLQLKIVQDGTFEMTPGKGVIENRPTCSMIESKGQAPGMSWKQEKIYEHMTFVKENADVIVPGHGAPFMI